MSARLVNWTLLALTFGILAACSVATTQPLQHASPRTADGVVQTVFAQGVDGSVEVAPGAVIDAPLAEQPPIIVEEALPTLPTRSFQVQLDSTGALVGRLDINDSGIGRIIPARTMVVQLLRDGQIMERGLTTGDGSVRFPGLAPGYYTAAVWGTELHCAFGLQVLPHTDAAPADGFHILLASQSDAVAVDHELTEIFGPLHSETSVPDGSTDSLPPAEAVPAHGPFGQSELEGEPLHEVAQVEHPPVVEQPAPGFGPAPEFSVDGEVWTSTPVKNYLVKGGHFDGRVVAVDPTGFSPLSSAALVLLRDGVAVARTAADEEGRFALHNLTTGAYTLLATGPESVCVVGLFVELDEGDAVAQMLRAEGIETVLIQNGQPGPDVELSGAPEGDVRAAGALGGLAPLIPPPGDLGPGGFGGGSSGGGGGGVGGGESLLPALLAGLAGALLGGDGGGGAVSPPGP